MPPKKNPHVHVGDTSNFEKQNPHVIPTYMRGESQICRRKKSPRTCGGAPQIFISGYSNALFFRAFVHFQTICVHLWMYHIRFHLLSQDSLKSAKVYSTHNVTYRSFSNDMRTPLDVSSPLVETREYKSVRVSFNLLLALNRECKCTHIVHFQTICVHLWMSQVP